MVNGVVLPSMVIGVNGKWGRLTVAGNRGRLTINGNRGRLTIAGNRGRLTSNDQLGKCYHLTIDVSRYTNVDGKWRLLIICASN